MRSWRDRCSWAITGNTQASGELPQHLTLSTLSELLTILPLNGQLRMPFLKMEVKSCISFLYFLLLLYSKLMTVIFRKAKIRMKKGSSWSSSSWNYSFHSKIVGGKFFWDSTKLWLDFVLESKLQLESKSLSNFYFVKLWWARRRKGYVSTWMTHWHA